MRKFWNQNNSLPVSTGGLSHACPTAKWNFATAAMAVAAGLFLLAPIANAQQTQPPQTVPGALPTQSTPPPPGPPPPPPVDQSSPSPAANAGPMAPAGVRVVRLSDVEGSVQIMRGDQTEFSQAVMNMPLLQGSRIVTGAEGRAAIEFEDGSVARITPNSSLSLKALPDSANGVLNTTVDQLSGLIYYELRNDPQTHYTVLAGDSSVTPTANSTIRVNLGANPPEVAVLDGSVQVNGVDSSYQADVKQNQTIQLGAVNGAKYSVSDGIIPNGFDDWNTQLDQQAAEQAQNQTSARAQQGGGSIMDSGYGWSDLDSAGGWYPLPGYGMVWQPYGMGPGFNPYGYGMWGNYGPFGYTWISGYPWGWLPFHCGMWSDIADFGWGWMPGPYGCGGGFGIGFGYYYGGYGWYGRRHRHHPDGDHDADDQARRRYTNIAHAPAGYRAPVPPKTVKGVVAPRLVRVGSPAILNTGKGVHEIALHNPRAIAGTPRSVRFNGTKIAPLHSVMTGVNVPVRNAALFNNYPAHAFPGGIRSAMLNRESNLGGYTPARGSANRLGPIARTGAGNHSPRLGDLNGRTAEIAHGSIPHGPATNGPVMHGSLESNRAGTFNAPHGDPFAGRGSFGGSRGGFANRAAFGQHTSFGPRGGFGGVHSAFSNGGAARSGFGGARSAGFSGGRASGFSGGGHAGGFSGGSHGGGGFAGGGSHGGGGGHAH